MVEILGRNLEICETPGNHYTIYMEPNVDALEQDETCACEKPKSKRLR